MTVVSWLGATTVMLALAAAGALPLSPATPFLALALGTPPVALFVARRRVACERCGGRMRISTGFPRIVFRCRVHGEVSDTGVHADSQSAGRRTGRSWYKCTMTVTGADNGNPTPRVKVCCIASVDEARLAVRHGAAAIGLVSAMPSGPGVIPDELIAEIAAAMAPVVATFLLTSRQTAAGVIEQLRRVRAGTVQLCDRLVEGTHDEIRAALPGVGIVQVVHVTGDEAVAEATEVAPRVDAILLDSGSRSAAIRQLGGTGRTHDWRVSRVIRDAVRVPVWLAGGLRPENVAGAIAAVAPAGVDVCTGVRSGGKLDEARLAAFFRAVGSAPPHLEAHE